jgi:hypothetical protein
MSQPIRISTGQEFRLSNTTPSIEEAALAGARICRYAGRSKIFWSIVIHSLIVSSLLSTPLERFYGLVHDVATEAGQLGDILKPLKVDVLKEVEQQVYFKTLRKWQIPLPDKEIVARVHEADVLAYLGELRTVAPSGHLPQYHRRIPVKIERLTRRYMKMARRPARESVEVKEFLKQYYRLKTEAFGS